MSGDAGEGRFAYEGLDRVLHEKARLGILTSLSTRPEGLLFGDLKRLCALTDGNLNRHLEVLQEAGLVEVWKRFEGRRPQTLVRLGAEGRRLESPPPRPPMTPSAMRAGTAANRETAPRMARNSVPDGSPPRIPRCRCRPMSR